VARAKGRTERQRRRQECRAARRDAGVERLRALVDQVMIDTRLFRAAVRQGAGFRTVLARAEEALATLRHARARTLVLLSDSIIDQDPAHRSNGSRRQNGTQADV